VGGISSRWLETDGVAHDQGAGDGIGARGDHAEIGIGDGVVVEAASELADGAGCLESFQRGGHAVAGAEVCQVCRSEDPTAPLPVNAVKNLTICRCGVFRHGLNDTKNTHDLCQNKIRLFQGMKSYPAVR